MFLILPTLYLVVGAFQNNAGEFTLENILRLSEPSIRSAYWISLRISLASAGLGALIGLAIAIAVVRGGLPQWIRASTPTFSGVASNFAGVPLALPRDAPRWSPSAARTTVRWSSPAPSRR